MYVHFLILAIAFLFAFTIVIICHRVCLRLCIIACVPFIRHDILSLQNS